MKYSAVIPVFNEAENLNALYKELKKAMECLCSPYELIFVNDGSKDKSLDILQNLQLSDQNIVIINVKQNLGQAKALQAGFDRACGEIVISIDADMQNNPTDIPLLLNKLNQGYDVICGWRRNRQDNLLKRCSSCLGNICQRLLLHVPVHDISCTLRVYKRTALKQIKLKEKGEINFILFFLKRKGYKISEVAVQHRPRLFGHSKYGILSVAFQVTKTFLRIYFTKNNRR